MLWEELHTLRNKYISLGIQQAIDYELFCMISIVYNSTKIEGCSLSESDTKLLIKNNITAAGKPLTDHLMVKDHYAAFLQLKQLATEKRKISLSFIQDLGAMVMKSTGSKVSSMAGDFDVSKGELRLAQVFVDTKYFPHFSKVPHLLKQLIENTNQKIDKVTGNDILKLSADVHYNFVNIHPFGDGNGRASRLLMNYIQMYHSEPLIKIFSEDRAAYINALNETEEKENLDIFRDFIAGQQIKFYKAEIQKFESLSEDKGLLWS